MLRKALAEEEARRQQATTTNGQFWCKHPATTVERPLATVSSHPFIIIIDHQLCHDGRLDAAHSTLKPAPHNNRWIKT
jgi:hypothetical protein